ncbi:MAG: hypothetical protein AMS18_00120 [Gemmatimonas sp. SG8_17]|nr:MAG: hypothetical protein AMS18_00120 [Gemmatimonas sp. SG8_17]
MINLKGFVAPAIAVALAFFCVSLYISNRSLNRNLDSAIIQRDSAYIEAGIAQREVEGWTGRFGMPADEAFLERNSDKELVAALRRENRRLTQRLDARVTVVDTVTVRADTVFVDTTGAQILHFAERDTTGFSFEAWVNARLADLRLEWQLDLELSVRIAENKAGRPDVFIEAPKLADNTTITIGAYDYVAHKRSLWSRISVGPMGFAGSNGASVGVVGCIEPVCGYWSPLGNDIGVGYLWRPFK